jgi:hypothetical protein
MLSDTTRTQRVILRVLRDLLHADTAGPPLLLVGGLQRQLADAAGISVEQLRAEIDTLNDRGYVLARAAPGRRLPDSDPILIDGLTPRGALAAARWPTE